MKKIDNELKKAILRKMQELQQKALEIEGACFDVELRASGITVWAKAPGVKDGEGSEMVTAPFKCYGREPLDEGLEALCRMNGIIQGWQMQQQMQQMQAELDRISEEEAAAQVNEPDVEF